MNEFNYPVVMSSDDPTFKQAKAQMARLSRRRIDAEEALDQALPAWRKLVGDLRRSEAAELAYVSTYLRIENIERAVTAGFVVRS